MVSEDEWRLLRRHFSADRAISVSRNRAGNELLASDPPVCYEFVSKRHEMEEQVRSKFLSHFVYPSQLYLVLNNWNPELVHPLECFKSRHNVHSKVGSVPKQAATVLEP